ncbi:unnamed protein product [Microthlaspi erraticum]|uniref:Uncharacterized protein n=1 Tax=Microthlaspi erraticum TaxID=1685480 RepID=A0A6D2HKP9_9BRAS|nr:unnamed protein product [Microthlaspi erraticum]
MKFCFSTGHLWVQVFGVVPDKPLDSAVLSRMKQFSEMNKFKKMALRVIAESLSEEEIAGLKEMFNIGRCRQEWSDNFGRNESRTKTNWGESQRI